MNANNITAAINYVMAFLAVVLAGLQGFDWVALVGAATALKIVAGLNLLGILAKAWTATARQMAKSMAAAPAAKTSVGAT
ncbi:hypothetical protein [Rhizobium miluonense]|uniref:Uncharacterized protein n=1 Tax=Rhizobium miluonense TaxID=411945 RepID=A0A1C3XA60_9HYPH|nr:hypothetical protein [Rhizobium miluonense]SCB49065.1 hypothetical protein GA0061102_10714 [Rhizobium miluonense]